MIEGFFWFGPWAAVGKGDRCFDFSFNRPVRLFDHGWGHAFLIDKPGFELLDRIPRYPNSDFFLGAVGGADQSKFALVMGLERSEEHTSELQSPKDLVC